MNHEHGLAADANVKRYQLLLWGVVLLIVVVNVTLFVLFSRREAATQELDDRAPSLQQHDTNRPVPAHPG